MQEISFRNDILPLKDKLFRLALRITLDRAEAEDVVQDTMIRVWNKRDEWSQFESVEAYCLIVAKNLAIDRSQKKEAQNVELTPEMEEEPDANSPYDRMIHDEKMNIATASGCHSRISGRIEETFAFGSNDGGVGTF